MLVWTKHSKGELVIKKLKTNDPKFENSPVDNFINISQNQNDFFSTLTKKFE